MANLHLVFPMTRTTRELRKRVPLAPDTRPGVINVTGFTTVPDGHEEIFYKTVIDLDELARLAQKAAGNRSGMAKDGALRVYVTERNRLGVKK